ncbi:Rv2732c family membrane protein [Rhodococcus triatomae]|nr:hypothetical protein G419_22159 [Rhodococcus triatomae BKS 15-14]
MSDDLSDLRAELAAIEKRVTREVAVGRRGRALAAMIAVLAVGLFLPHAGPVSGWAALVGGTASGQVLAPVPLRLFVLFVLVFGIVASTVALLTRRWILAQTAVMGTAVGAVFGMLGLWSQQSLPPALRPDGVEYGLLLTWLSMTALSVLWIPVVAGRSNIMSGPPR